MTAPSVPDHEGLIEILQAEGAPSRITLDIGGSADIDGDGLVAVRLSEDGKSLIFEDV